MAESALWPRASCAASEINSTSRVRDINPHFFINEIHFDPVSPSADRFGGGYTLKVNFDPSSEGKVSGFISEQFPGASISGDFRGTKEIRLDVSANVAHVFMAMERESRQAGITDYSISQVGLEDVFQRIVDESKRGDD